MDASPIQITDDLRGTFRGTLHFDTITRGLYATDASPFQVTPLGVAIPADEDDVAALVKYCFERQIPIIPRGAGTGVSGESLGYGLVVDLSQNFRRIVEIGKETATVQPGVVYAELNAALAKVGRRFAPDPASGNTCTIGGMVATNASGGNAFRFGYTRDYVSGMRGVWDSGAKWAVKSGQWAAGSGQEEKSEKRTGKIVDEASSLLRANQEIIANAGPITRFNRCGYLLQDVLGENGLDLSKLLTGSEGTLAVVTEATLRTVPLPGGRCIVLLGFGSLDAATRAGLELRAFEPVACDLLDQRLLSLTRTGRSGEAASIIPAGIGAALIAVWEADTEREALERTHGAIDRLRETYRLAVLAEPTCDPEDSKQIQAVRESAVAGLFALGPGPRPVAFIEDVGVPPDALPEYLTRVQDLLQQFELTGSLLVHVLAGQVHARPLIDMNREPDRAKLWPLAEAVHAAALALGGTVSTQHGTGLARTPWVEKQYGPLAPVFRELKRIFDPKGILNPGKIIGPDPSRPAWPLRPEIRAQESGNWNQETGNGGQGSGIRKLETGIEAEGSGSSLTADSRLLTPLLVWGSEQPSDLAATCNGCGDCRPRARGERTCPIFHAIGTEAATPRAKANLVRLMSMPDADPAGLASDEAAAIAALCVNCKMCRDTCHARIDIPKLMLEAKAAHQAEHGMDWSDWVFSRLEMVASTGSNFAPFVNLLLARRSVRWMLERLFGLSRHRRLPAFAQRSFLKRARGAGLTRKGVRSQGLGVSNPSSLTPNPYPLTPVALFVDVFANYNDPLIAQAAVAVLQHHGIQVYVPPRQSGSGMAPLTNGDVEAAREVAARNVRLLADLVREGYTVVVLEPTATVMLAQDYLNLLDDADVKAVAANVVELTTYLWRLHEAGQLRTDFTKRIEATLGHHVPCHVKALHGPLAGPRLLSLIPGVRVHTIDVSCSGMAGVYGLRASNHAASLAAGRPMLDEMNRPAVLFGSTECSACRVQMQEGADKRTLHPVQYLAYAYGLMPEIGTKLQQPLGDLVSD